VTARRRVAALAAYTAAVAAATTVGALAAGIPGAVLTLAAVAAWATGDALTEPTPDTDRTTR
jgi:hypothetical protein